MQGLPGSGKTTVAKELAGTSGKIISVDKLIVERTKKIANDQSTIQAIYDEIFE